MKAYRIYQVDSFTRELFRGNPAGVVPNADGLTAEQMQQIAGEMNLSETAFVFSPHSGDYDSGDYDVEVRFFTPKTEVPICGHATVAAHYVRAVEGDAVPGRVIQKTKAGLLPVEIIGRDGNFAIVMTQGKPEIGEPLGRESVKRLTDALGISVSELREDCPIAVASTGHSKVMIGIKSLEWLHGLKPDLAALSSLSADIGCNGYYVFTLSPKEEILVHGRMFSPAVGVAEDPVTGNANGPLGAYMVHYGICRDLMSEDAFDFTIVQGEAIGRAGTMQVHIGIENGKPVLAQITGEAVIVFSAVIGSGVNGGAAPHLPADSI